MKHLINFKGYDTDSKLNTLFDLAVESHECACRTEERIDALERKVDRRKIFDKGIAGISGIIGGAAMYLVTWWQGQR